MNAATKLPGDVGLIHFVGIGGIGMSGIAEVLLNHGYRVQGSDLKSTPITRRLEELGAHIFEGQRASRYRVRVDLPVGSILPDEVRDKVRDAMGKMAMISDSDVRDDD